MAIQLGIAAARAALAARKAKKAKKAYTKARANHNKGKGSYEKTKTTKKKLSKANAKSRNLDQNLRDKKAVAEFAKSPKAVRRKLRSSDTGRAYKKRQELKQDVTGGALLAGATALTANEINKQNKKLDEKYKKKKDK